MKIEINRPEDLFDDEFYDRKTATLKAPFCFFCSKTDYQGDSRKITTKYWLGCRHWVKPFNGFIGNRPICWRLDYHFSFYYKEHLNYKNHPLAWDHFKKEFEKTRDRAHEVFDGPVASGGYIADIDAAIRDIEKMQKGGKL